MFAVQVVRRQWSERAFGNDSALDIPTEALQVNQSALLDAEAKADSVTVALVLLRVFSFDVHAFRLLIRLLPRPTQEGKAASRPQVGLPAKEEPLATTAEYRVTSRSSVSRGRGRWAEVTPTRPRSTKGLPTFPFSRPGVVCAPSGFLAGTASKVRRWRG